MPTNNISAFIVDDEQLAIDVVKQLLQSFPEIEVVGCATKSKEAVKMIIELKPQLLFLDIQMPSLNGFQLLTRVLEFYSPYVVFTTAYDQYAIQAFDMHAQGYLLKPLQREKFIRTVSKAMQTIQRPTEESAIQRLQLLLQTATQLTAQEKPLERIMIRDAKRILYVNTSEILYIEAAGDYVKVICSDQTYLAHYTLQQLQLDLPPQQFVRIHRSWIIRIDAVKEFIPHFNGEYYVVMKQGDRLKLSRHYKTEAAQYFKGL